MLFTKRFPINCVWYMKNIILKPKKYMKFRLRREVKVLLYFPCILVKGSILGFSIFSRLIFSYTFFLYKPKMDGECLHPYGMNISHQFFIWNEKRPKKNCRKNIKNPKLKTLAIFQVFINKSNEWIHMDFVP